MFVPKKSFITFWGLYPPFKLRNCEYSAKICTRLQTTNFTVKCYNATSTPQQHVATQSDNLTMYVVHYTFFTAELKMSSWRKCIYILHFAFSSMGQKRVVTILHTTFYISWFHVLDYILHSTFATSSVCWNYILHSTYSISGRAPTFVIYICRSEK